MPQSSPRNPQTVALLEMLGLPYNLDPSAPPLAPLGGGAAAAGDTPACFSWTTLPTHTCAHVHQLVQCAAHILDCAAPPLVPLVGGAAVGEILFLAVFPKP